MGDYPRFPSAVPLRGVGCRRLTHPFATPPRGVRLACLIHAANVHSEPGSNPSKKGWCHRPRPIAHHPLTERAREEKPRAPEPPSGGPPREGPAPDGSDASFLLIIPPMIGPGPARRRSPAPPRSRRATCPVRRSVAGPPRGHAGRNQSPFPSRPLSQHPDRHSFAERPVAASVLLPDHRAIRGTSIPKGSTLFPRWLTHAPARNPRLAATLRADPPRLVPIPTTMTATGPATPRAGRVRLAFPM